MQSYFLFELFRIMMSAAVGLLFFNLVIPEKITTKTAAFGSIYFAAYTCLVYVLITQSVHVTLFEYMGALLINLGYLVWIKKCAFFKAIYLSVFCQAVSLVSAIMALVVIRHIWGQSVRSVVFHTNIYSAIFFIISKTVQIAVLYGVAKRNYFLEYLTRPMLLFSAMLYTLIASLSVGIANIVFYFDDYSSETMQLMIMCFLITLVSLAALNYFSKFVASQVNREVKNEQEITAQKYLSEVTDMHENSLRLRHDFHTHVMVMKNLLQNGNLKPLMDYLNELSQENEEIPLIINTGNVLIDAILNVKIRKAETHDIDTRLRYYLPPALQISDVDLCVILGNLLDNAIEACEKIKEGRYINLTFRKVKETFIIIVENPTNGIVKMEGSHFLTTKTFSLHGFGLNQVSYVCKKYGGYFNGTHQNNIFKVEVMLPNINYEHKGET